MKALEQVSRITPGALLCRGLAFGFTLAALVMAIPGWALGTRTLGAAMIGGLLVAVAPATRIVTIVLLGAVAGWFVSLLNATESLTLWRLIGFAAALYLAHSSAALAAVVPLDAVVSPEVLARWYLKSLGIVGVTAVMALVLLVGSALVVGWNTTWIASVLGLFGALGVITLLARLHRR